MPSGHPQLRSANLLTIDRQTDRERERDTFSMIVAVVRNEIGSPSSNPGRGWVSQGRLGFLTLAGQPVKKTEMSQFQLAVIFLKINFVSYLARSKRVE